MRILYLSCYLQISRKAAKRQLSEQLKPLKRLVSADKKEISNKSYVELNKYLSNQNYQT